MTNKTIVIEIGVVNNVVKKIEEEILKEENLCYLISALEKAQISANVALTEVIEQDRLSQTLDGNTEQDEESAEDDDDTDSESDDVSTPASVKRKLQTDNGNCKKIKKA